jgi:hypothetical protein
MPPNQWRGCPVEARLAVYHRHRETAEKPTAEIAAEGGARSPFRVPDWAVRRLLLRESFDRALPPPRPGRRSGPRTDRADRVADRPSEMPASEYAAQGIRGVRAKIIVAFRRCTCVGDEPGKGHTVVYCRVDGCRYRWCKPARHPRFGVSNNFPLQGRAVPEPES